MSKDSEVNYDKMWKLLLPPYCFGNPYHYSCTAKRLPEFCCVSGECIKECRRREKEDSK